MQDAIDCTIIVPFPQLVDDYIPSVKKPGFKEEFAARFPPQTIAAIRQMFLVAAKKIEGVSEERIKEAELTKVWVRYVSLFVRDEPCD